MAIIRLPVAKCLVTMTPMDDVNPSPSLASSTLRETRIALFDDHWQEAEAWARPLVAAGLPMAEVVARFGETQRGPYKGIVPPQHLGKLGGVDLGRFATLPPPHRLTVASGRYATLAERSQYDLLAEAVMALLDPSVDCLVELGSGPGLNLARLALDLGERGRRLAYVACEPSAGGRRTTGLLFANGGYRLIAEDYDHTAPLLPFLAPFRRIVAFTCHSIEQVPALGRGLYDALFALPVIACVHLEPVGWQRFSNIAAAVLEAHRDMNRCQWFRRDYVHVMQDDRLVENAAAWSAAHLYNTDLLRLVAAASEAGEIAIRRLDYDIVGENPFNPSTRIVWTR